MRTFKIPNEIYDLDTIVIFGGTAAEIRKHLKKEYTEECLSAVFGDEALDGAFAFVDFLERRDDKEDNYVMWFESDRPEFLKKFLAHELVHLTWNILNDRQVKIGYKNNEAQAYLMSYYVTKIYVELKQ